MKKSKNLFLVAGIIILTLLISACTPEDIDGDAEEVIDNGGAYEVDVKGMEEAEVEKGGDEEEEETEEKEDLPNEDEPVRETTESFLLEDDPEKAKDDNLKVLSSYTMNAETKDFDEVIDKITDEVHKLNGYISKKEVDKTRDTHLSVAEVSIRVPREDLKTIVAFIDDNLFVSSESFLSADITENYSSVESKLDILEAKEKRLKELYEVTDEVSKIIEIDDKISELEEERSEITRKKEKMDRGIAFSKLDLNIEEVKKFSSKKAEDEEGMLYKAFEVFKIALMAGALIFFLKKYIFPKVKREDEDEEKKDEKG